MIPSVPLRAVDRCDRCSAAARVRAIKDVAVLLFCGHHARAHHDALTAQGWLLDYPREEPSTHSSSHYA